MARRCSRSAVTSGVTSSAGLTGRGAWAPAPRPLARLSRTVAAEPAAFSVLRLPVLVLGVIVLTSLAFGITVGGRR